MATDTKFVYPVGVSAATGDYTLAPIAIEQVAAVAMGAKPGDEKLRYLKDICDDRERLGAVLNVKRLEDPREAGWGIVFHESESQSVIDALRPLLTLREGGVKGAGRSARFRQLTYQPDESFLDWITRYKGDPSVVNPDRVPYYLLVIGAPDRIPYEFTQDLAVSYCVGRLDFETVDSYRHYAASVVIAEANEATQARCDVTYFAPLHEGDRATEMSANQLVRPLYDSMSAWAGRDEGLLQRLIIGPEARKAALLQSLLGEQRQPRFIFTAGHGIGFPAADPRQKDSQGALLCQDWRGPRHLTSDAYLAAADIPATASLAGSICCSFACYSAGTPTADWFSSVPDLATEVLTDVPFVSGLAKHLLDLRGGPALAFVGHVGRAWSFSFSTLGAAQNLDSFEVLCQRVLSGSPIGLAIQGFSGKYAMLSISLEELRQKRRLGFAVPDEKLSRVWLARNDAATYAVIGDPAARLAVRDSRSNTSR